MKPVIGMALIFIGIAIDYLVFTGKLGGTENTVYVGTRQGIGSTPSPITRQGLTSSSSTSSSGGSQVLIPQQTGGANNPPSWIGV